MTKIEPVEGWLVSVDTDKNTLRIRFLPSGIISVPLDGESTYRPPERDYPYNLDSEDQQVKRLLGEDGQDFYRLLNRKIEAVVSDGVIVEIKLFGAE